MVSHSLTVAKASLAAACIRPDPAPVPREQVNSFHELLDAALERCSYQNIQRCTEWLASYILPSPAKAAALAKYMLAVSGSCKEDTRGSTATARCRRKQLHVLYILHDALHTAKFHKNPSSSSTSFTESVSEHVPVLVAHAASHQQEKYPRHHAKLAQLLEIWERQQYFAAAFTEGLRKVLQDPSLGKDLSATYVSVAEEPGNTNNTSKDVPFEMPAHHGDPSAPYYELPAATMLPHIVPKSNIPIDPLRMRAMQLKPGPADKRLTSAVKGFLRDADLIYGMDVDDEEVAVQIDEIGQLVYQDKITGEAIGGESYYGWSKQFCELMKRPPSEGSRRSRSHSPRRRRNSSSMDRSRSRSSSRSPRPYDRQQNNSQSRTPSRSQFQSRSHDPRRRSTSPPHPAIRDRAHSQVMGAPQVDVHPAAFQQSHGQPQGQFQPLIPMPLPFPGGFPLGANGLPLPPPRPPNWAGPWPPPPPHLQPGSGPSPPFFQFPGFAPPPPPPPPAL